MSRHRVPLLVALLTSSAAPLALAAQDPVARAAILQREFEAAVRAEQVADSTRDAFWKERDASRNRLARIGGVWLRFSLEEVVSEDTAVIAEGLRRAQAQLVERFGQAGERLTPGDTIVVRGFDRSVGSGLRARFLRTAAGSRGFGRVGVPRVTMLRRPGNASYGLHYPLRVADVERMALRWAGERLPSLGGFGGSQVSLASEPQVWQEAGRELALSWATTGRRCLVGALGACELVMTTRPASGPAPAWIEAQDLQSAVAASISPPFADSLFVADRRRCLDTDVTLCQSVLDRMQLRDPFSPKLRASLVMHALDLGGREGLARLADGSRGTPLAQAAHAAGMSESQLLASWQARVSAAAEGAQEGPFAGVVATAGWCALLIGFTLRRRPTWL